MERIPIVIDTDPGIDDFFCLALACAYSDRLDLRAVTTMGGNNHTDVTTQNALNILSLFRTDVPVARGADRYLEAEFCRSPTGRRTICPRGTSSMRSQRPRRASSSS